MTPTELAKEAIDALRAEDAVACCEAVRAAAEAPLTAASSSAAGQLRLMP